MLPAPWVARVRTKARGKELGTAQQRPAAPAPPPRWGQPLLAPPPVRPGILRRGVRESFPLATHLPAFTSLPRGRAHLSRVRRRKYGVAGAQAAAAGASWRARARHGAQRGKDRESELCHGVLSGLRAREEEVGMVIKSRRSVALLLER
ncbi:hypothetical protein NN561_008488 [Cricetulus griseus]